MGKMRWGYIVCYWNRIEGEIVDFSRPRNHSGVPCQTDDTSMVD